MKWVAREVSFSGFFIGEAYQIILHTNLLIMKIRKAQFVKSTLKRADAPTPLLPEFAFVGRSNVGKSSLINTLVNIKNFARVSKQPGKTRAVNYFIINNAFYLVDLPGYGFARVGKGEKRKWQEAIEGYLLENAQLQLLFVLIDAKVGVKPTDRQLMEWLQYHQIPFQIIATKVDQIGRSQWHTVEQTIRKELHLLPEQSVVFFSAKNRIGRDVVWSIIEAHLKKR